MDVYGRFFEEIVSGMGPELTRIKKLLDRLRSYERAWSPSLGERIQGGDHIPAAEMRMEILEKLKKFSPMEIEIVQLFEAQREKKKIAYCLALMDGISGEKMQSRGIGAGKQFELRDWLSKEMQKITRRHGGL